MSMIGWCNAGQGRCKGVTGQMQGHGMARQVLRQVQGHDRAIERAGARAYQERCKGMHGRCTGRAGRCKGRAEQMPGQGRKHSKADARSRPA